MEIVYYTSIATIVLVMGWIVWAVITENNNKTR